MSPYNRDLWPVVTRLRNCVWNLSNQEPAVVCGETAAELVVFSDKEQRAAVLLSDAQTLFRIAESKLREARDLLEAQAQEYDDDATGGDDA